MYLDQLEKRHLTFFNVKKRRLLTISMVLYSFVIGNNNFEINVIVFFVTKFLLFFFIKHQLKQNIFFCSFGDSVKLP